MDNNHQPKSKIIFAEDPQFEEFHKIVHKIVIPDQNIKTISTATLTLDQNQTEVITQTLIKTVHIQTSGLEKIPLTVQKFFD